MPNEIDITEARKRFTHLDDLLEDESIIWITRRGQRAFAVMRADTALAVLDAVRLLGNPDQAAKLKRAVDALASPSRDG